MPRIEGNFAISRGDVFDYVEVVPDPGEQLYYVLDDGSRMRIEFPQAGVIEDGRDMGNYLKLVPVGEAVEKAA